MASVYKKGKKLWASVKDSTGEWIARPTPYAADKGLEAKAEKWARELQRLLDSEHLVSSEANPVTVDAYAKTWIASRRKDRIQSAGDDEARLEIHALPKLGQLRLDEVRPRHIRDLVLDLRRAGTLAPRSVRHVYSVLATMFRVAIADELIAASPCVLKRGVLPKKVDKDPAWRAGAIFTREEVERLISDESIMLDRRVFYALKALGAFRHSEAAGLRWSDYDTGAEPLGRLTLSKTKSEVPRQMPVHPVLAKILATWKLTGWREVYGAQPKPGDLIVPTRNGTMRDAPGSQAQFLADLARLGMRRRRGHDLRRSFISLARTDGAIDSLLETVTHGQRGDIISQYSTFQWAALCAEVAKLRISLRGAAKVGRLSTALSTASKNSNKRWMIRGVPNGIRTQSTVHEDAPHDANPVESHEPESTAVDPRSIAVENLSTAIARASRVGNLPRARVLLERLQKALEALEEQTLPKIKEKP